MTNAGVRAGTASDDARPERGLTVLCIEDDVSTAALIVRVLSTYDVHVASDGAEGVRLLHDLEPDILLLDRYVDGIHGDEILRRLRADPRTETLRVVMLTAAAESDVAADLLRAGAHAVVSKPFRPDELRATVSRVLRDGGTRASSTGRRRSEESLLGTLDTDLLAALDELSADFGGLHDVVRSALHDASVRVDALHAAVGAQDLDAVGRHAHAVRGALGSLGATVVVQTCERLETSARSGNPLLLHEALLPVVEAVRSAGDALLDRYPPGR